MKLKYLVLGLASSAILYSCGGAQENTAKDETAVVDSTGTEESFAVNTENSVITWKGVMANIKSHSGTLKLKEGSLKIKGNQVTGGSFVADMIAMTPTDTNYNADYTKEKLVGHLQTEDFFATDSFPTATFVVKSMEGNTIKGDLTVRGKTNEEQVTDVVIEKSESGVKATGKLVFDRQKYGVAWKSPMKDMILNDDIEVDIVLVGQK